VMEAPVISISLEVSVESVGSIFSRVILIGSISIEVPVAPEVGVAVVASPAGLLELDTHSLSKDGPSKSSPPPVSVAPMVLPFLCSNDLESDSEIPKRHVSPIPHDSMLTKWRSRAALRSLSPTNSILEIPTAPILPATSAIVTPSSEFLLALVVAPPEIHRRRAILSWWGIHTPPDTIDANSSTPPRFVHPSLARTPRLDRDVKAGVDTSIGMKVDVRINVEDERIEDIETVQRELEARNLIAGGERASLLEQVASLERSNARLRDIMMMERVLGFSPR
nr:hypothetical protein [Tanacetum cinerariifolium]